MERDADYLFALKLQSELNNSNKELTEVTSKRKYREQENDSNLNATQNIVHPEWETIDPTPDIYSLFGAFDLKFFQGKLKCVELEWSKRMYQCAGICYQRRNRLGMSITIRLSEPLLKLRTRRNLIETLLHEMIHAYLFILNIREGNGGHGPNFVKIMSGINKTAGTNITVYHNFHDEVEMYKTHVWRCNGICQHRKPFFGWIKRTSNRAPGQNDNWWISHQQSCGGVFEKVSQPEPKRIIKKAKPATETLPKITNWLNGTNKPSPGGSNRFGSGFGSNTIVIKPSTKTKVVPSATDNRRNTISNTSYIPPQTTVGGNLRNVIGLKDLNSSDAGVQKQPTPKLFTDNGKKLGTDSSTPNTLPIAENIRNIWANKFDNCKTSTDQTNSAAIEFKNVNKANDVDPPTNQASTSQWKLLDDDIMIHEVQHVVFDISDSDSDNEIQIKTKPKVKIENAEIHHKTIHQELMDDIGDADDVIELIDDEFYDELHDKSLELLTDTSVIDDIFGSDTLMADFNNINDVIKNDPENRGNPCKEIITCPICQERMPREQLTTHLEGCTGITVKVEPKWKGIKKPLPFYKNMPTASTSTVRKSTVNNPEKEALLKAGYSQSVIDRLIKEEKDGDEYNKRIMDEIEADERKKRNSRTVIESNVLEINNDIDIDTRRDEQHPCPVCSILVNASRINQHLDRCLQGIGDE